MFRIPLSAVGYYIVAKFTPVAPDGEVGEPAYATLHGIVESKCFSSVAILAVMFVMFICHDHS